MKSTPRQEATRRSGLHVGYKPSMGRFGTKQKERETGCLSKRGAALEQGVFNREF